MNTGVERYVLLRILSFLERMIDEDGKYGKKGSGVIIWGVAILSILLGVGIFLYPFISNFFAELSQNKVIDIYKANVEDTSKEEIEAEWEEAKIYNENLSEILYMTRLSLGADMRFRTIMMKF